MAAAPPTLRRRTMRSATRGARLPPTSPSWAGDRWGWWPGDRPPLLHGEPDVRQAGRYLLERIAKIGACLRGVEVVDSILRRRGDALEHVELVLVAGKAEADDVQLDAFVPHIQSQLPETVVQVVLPCRDHTGIIGRADRAMGGIGVVA